LEQAEDVLLSSEEEERKNKLKMAAERSFFTNLAVILIITIVFVFLISVPDRLIAALVTASSMKCLLPVATTVANFGNVQIVLKLYVDQATDKFTKFKQWAFSN
jgi:uncharacterized membrane protein (DUF485 family)